MASMTSWQRRQTVTAASGLRRYPTRRINLLHDAVLSVDYPVPSAIRNSVEAKHRDPNGTNAEEFTHLRCKADLE
jgi:chitin synthase